MEDLSFGVIVGILKGGWRGGVYPESTFLKCTSQLKIIKKMDRNPLHYIIQVISHVICLPYVRCRPEDISQMRVGDGETNHWNNIGYQEKHNLRISCIKISVHKSTSSMVLYATNPSKKNNLEL